MKNILEIMSEFLALGMNVQDIIAAVTWNPARMIRHEELGNMSPGAIADITILKLYNSRSTFCDPAGLTLESLKNFDCIFTIKSGKVVNEIR